MADSRTRNSIRNTSMSALAQLVGILLNFVGRTFFIKLLSVEYLGINGLFGNIITILSLAELGVGTAIVYMMYEPIAKGNTAKVAAYNSLFRKIYNCIGCFVFFAGLCVIPFLDVIIKESPKITENITIIYILFLLNTSVSYFFTYKRSLLIAHQKEYLNSKNIIYFAIIKDVVLIIILVLTANYYFYLIAQICITFSSNVAISRVANKHFPEIVNQKGCGITKEEKKTIVKNTSGMLCHKIGAVIVSGTDNILISSFVGIATVGVFSNYKLIQNVAVQLISRAVNAVTASVGNLVASTDNDRVYEVFKKLYFLNFTLAFFTSVMFYALIDAFIAIWIGKEFIIDHFSMMIIATNLFFIQIRVPSQVIINSYGVFWQIKWKSIVEAIINLASSLFFASILDMGLKGILLGTIVSTVSTNLWWEPYGAYHYAMRKPLKEYAIMFMGNMAAFFLSLGLIYFVNLYIQAQIQNNYLVFFTEAITSAIIAIMTYLLLYGKSSGFEYAKTFVRNHLVRNK